MNRFPLTVYPETDGDLCGKRCPMLKIHEEAECAAFGYPDFSVELGWYRRLPACIESEKDSTIRCSVCGAAGRHRVP